MAIEKVVIAPIKPGIRRIAGKYDDPTKNETVLIRRDKTILHGGFTPADEKQVFSFLFNPVRNEIVTSYEPGGTEKVNKREEAFIKEICRMPNVIVEGKTFEETEDWKNYKATIRKEFKVRFLSGIGKEMAIDITLKNETVSKFLALDLAQMQDVAFAFGVNAFNYPLKSELVVKLIGEKYDGVLLMPENIKSFMEYDPENKITYYRTVVNKAVNKKIIKYTKKGYEGTDKLGNEFLGYTIEDVMNYFDQNSRMMEVINKELSSTGAGEDDLKNEKRIKPDVAAPKPTTLFQDEDMERLRQECVFYGIDITAYNGNKFNISGAIKRAKDKKAKEKTAVTA